MCHPLPGGRFNPRTPVLGTRRLNLAEGVIPLGEASRSRDTSATLGARCDRQARPLPRGCWRAIVMPPPKAPELQVTNAQTHCQSLEIGPCTVPRVPPERDFYRSLIRTWTVAALPSVLPRSARSPSSRPRFNAWKPAAHTQRAVVGQRKPAAQRMRAV